MLVRDNEWENASDCNASCTCVKYFYSCSLRDALLRLEKYDHQDGHAYVQESKIRSSLTVDVFFHEMKGLIWLPFEH